MAASEQVFSTPELHEAILLRLDMRDLLLAQRVSREWQAAIACSIKIQRKLFFASPTGGALVMMPLLSVLASNLDREVLVVRDIELNPLLNRVMRVIGHKLKGVGIELQMEYSALGSRDASWRSMHVTSPPVAEVRLLLHAKSSVHAELLVVNHVARPVKGTGLTIGSLVDSLRGRFGDKLDDLRIFVYASRGWIPGTF